MFVGSDDVTFAGVNVGFEEYLLRCFAWVFADCDWPYCWVSWVLRIWCCLGVSLWWVWDWWSFKLLVWVRLVWCFGVVVWWLRCLWFADAVVWCDVVNSVVLDLLNLLLWFIAV